MNQKNNIYHYFRFMIVLSFAWCSTFMLLSCQQVDQHLPGQRKAYIDQMNRLAMEKYEQSIDSTFHYIQLATAALRDVDYPKGRADLDNNLGTFYDAKGNPTLALRYFNTGHGIYHEIGDSSNMVQTFMNMAMVYVETGNTDKGLSAYQKAIQVGKHLKQDSIMSLLYYNFLLQYPDQFSKDSTTFYFGKIRTIAEKYKDTRVLTALDQLMADRQIDQGNIETGFPQLKQTIIKALSGGLNFAAMDMLIDLADRLKDSDREQSLIYYNQGYRLSQEKNYNLYFKIFARKLYNFYKEQGDQEQALQYSDTLLNLIDRQIQLANNSGVDYVDYALKEKELEKATQKSSYNGRLAMLIGLVCLLALIMLIYVWQSRRKARNNQKILRLQFEQAEAAKNALNQLNHNYDKLIKIIAHDLRNPIGVIFSISALLQQEPFARETAELVNMIHMAADSSKELINKLLETDFDRQLHLNKEPLNLDDIISMSIQLLRYRASEKNQALLYKGSKNLMACIDKNLFIRVIDNLVINAVKFSSEKSTIAVSLHKEGDTLIIKVKDSGIGIPESIRDKIFAPFTSAKRPGTRGEVPFGLGLYLSREIIEAQGGILYLSPDDLPNVKSKTGSLFVIELPAYDPMENPPGKSANAPNQTPPQK